MLHLFDAMLGAMVSAFRCRASLVAENLALRQQLAVQRVGRPPRLRPMDRALGLVLSRVWSRWVEVLARRLVPLAASQLGDLVRSRTELIAENAMLRQQLILADAGGLEAWVSNGGRQRALLRPPRP